VPSPTFTLVQAYETPNLTLYHFDLYRIESPAEVTELGLDDALDEGAVIVEWPEKGVPRRLSEDALHIVLTGTRLVLGGRSGVPEDPLAYEVILVDTAEPQRESILLPLRGSSSFELSGNGTRLIFVGSQERGTGLSILDLGTRDVTIGPNTSSRLSVRSDTAGERIIFESTQDLDPDVGNLRGERQLFLYDDGHSTVRQITRGNSGLESCVYSALPRAAISADGGTVAFVTRDGQGLSSVDGCHVFVYDVAEDTLRLVATLSTGNAASEPTVSGAGRWMTFVVSTPELFAYRGARIDLETGIVEFPLAGLTEFPTFDAVISEDASTVVISSRADLDPRVGNADHNQELFA
jgi:hypothetical protein